MSTLPAAHNRHGNVRGFRIAGSAFTIGALSLLVSNSAFAAETAGAILKKMAENYTKAKSFQASIVTIQAGKTPDGKAFTVTQNEQVQYKTPNLFHKSVKATGIGQHVLVRTQHKNKAPINFGVRNSRQSLPQGIDVTDGRNIVDFGA